MLYFYRGVYYLGMRSDTDISLEANSAIRISYVKIKEGDFTYKKTKLTTSKLKIIKLSNISQKTYTNLMRSGYWVSKMDDR